MSPTLTVKWACPKCGYREGAVLTDEQKGCEHDSEANGVVFVPRTPETFTITKDGLKRGGG